jgi:cobalt-zinc-cadmium efflux system protein
MYSGWTMIDPLLSALVGVLILNSAWGLIRDAGHILLEGTPTHLDTVEIGKDLEQHIDQVEEVHHVHAWSLSQDKLILTLHARIATHAHADSAVKEIHHRLAERFDIDHVTVQIEVDSCADGSVSVTPAN